MRSSLEDTQLGKDAMKVARDLDSLIARIRVDDREARSKGGDGLGYITKDELNMLFKSMMLLKEYAVDRMDGKKVEDYEQ